MNGWAQPDTIAIQGQLVQGDRSPLTGTRAYQLDFFTMESGGSAIETVTGMVDVSQTGRFTIATTATMTLAQASSLFYELGVDSASTPDGSVDAGDFFASRVAINSVLFAQNSNMLGGIAASRYVSVGDQNQVVVAGMNNLATGSESFIGAGRGNNVTGLQGFIGSGLDNISTGTGSIIVGGLSNVNSGIDAFIGGGRDNRVIGSQSVIVGGENNAVGGLRAGIVAGTSNRNDGLRSFIGGGSGNNITNTSGFVGAGATNTVTGENSMVGAGNNNLARGSNSGIMIGRNNETFGSQSMANGTRAKAISNGTFVWADSTDADFNSTADNQFLVRAGGGVGINKNDPAAGSLDVEGDIRFSGEIIGDVIRTEASGGVKLISGKVSANGNIIAGTGFSITKLETGLYQIDYDTPFTGQPLTFVTLSEGNLTLTSTVPVDNNSQSTVRVFDSTTGTATDPFEFNFMVIGSDI